VGENERIALEQRLADVRRKIASYDVGDKPSSPPAALLREEIDTINAIVDWECEHGEVILALGWLARWHWQVPENRWHWSLLLQLGGIGTVEVTNGTFDTKTAPDAKTVRKLLIHRCTEWFFRMAEQVRARLGR